MTASLDRSSTTLRMIEFFKIPRESGDCVVLLLVHPGLNLLGRYLPPSKVNDLLLADISRVRSASHVDAYMSSIEDTDVAEEMEAFDIMDLASFLECVPESYFGICTYTNILQRFSIQATHCLEALHK